MAGYETAGLRPTDGAGGGRVSYRHRQIAWATLIGFVAAFLTQVGSLLRNLRRGRRRRALLSVPGTLSLIPSMALFSWLDTEVDDDTVAVSFAAGALRRRIPLGDIESAEVVTVPWYYGWGARLTRRGWLHDAPRGWLYSVWGRQAVSLRLRGERGFTIGSDEPEVLLAAIEAARTGRSAASSASPTAAGRWTAAGQ
jgi:hypothetical protein